MENDIPRSAAASAHVPELLAPAGGYRAFLAAVAAGADAVYLGLDAFNARVSAEGFTEDELVRACALARRRGVAVYLTLNVYIKQNELAAALDLAGRALRAGVDALIVEDAGLICALRRSYPGVEIHLSTQAGAQSAAAVRAAARGLAVDRVTVAREMSVKELARVCSEGVQIEAFVHGAICVCYSGACTFSALRRARSAMRGDCTQPCRLSYGLEDADGATLIAASEGRYALRRRPGEGDKLLCPRDYLGIFHVEELARAGVAALKIEGRMKNPDYVYNVVGAYRAALDALAAGEPVPAEMLAERLARSFNRGFTDLYLRGRSGAELMSFERSCNQGLKVGEVTSVERDTVEIALERAVGEGDVLEIRSYPGPDAPADVPVRWPQIPVAVDAPASTTLIVRCKRAVKTASAVYVVRSAAVLHTADEAIACLEQVEAAGAGPTVSTEGAAARDVRVTHAPVVPRVPSKAAATSSACDEGEFAPVAVALVSTPAEALALVDAPHAEVAVHAWRVAEDPAAWNAVLPFCLLVLDEVCRDADITRMLPLARQARRIVCRNLGALELALTEGIAFEVAAPLYIANVEAAHWIVSLGARRIWLPEELSVSDAERLVHALAPAGVALGIATETIPQLMVLEHCILTTLGPCARSMRETAGEVPARSQCVACARRARAYRLVERDGSRLPTLVDALGRTRIFDNRPVHSAEEATALVKLGIAAVMIDASRLCAAASGVTV